MSRRRRRLELLHIRPRIRRTLIIRDALNPAQHHLPRRLHRPVSVLENALVRAQHPHLREAVHVHVALHPDQRPQSRILEVHDRPRQPRHTERFRLRLIRHPLHRNPIRMLKPVNHRPARTLTARRRHPILVQDELKEVTGLIPVHDRQQIVHPVNAVIPHTSRILSRPEMNQRRRLTITASSVHNERRPIQHRRRPAAPELRHEPILVQQFSQTQITQVDIRLHEPVQVATSSQTIHSLRRPPQSNTHPVILRRNHRRDLLTDTLRVVIRLPQQIARQLIRQLPQQHVHQAVVVIRQTRHPNRLNHNTTACLPLEDLPARMLALPFCANHNPNAAACTDVISATAVLREKTHIPVSPKARLPAT